jgi:hypothetical protein
MGDRAGITAGTLAVQASTGVGTSANPLVTTVSNLSAQSATGGIFIKNTGNLDIIAISGVYGLFLRGKNGGGSGWAFGDYDFSGGRPDATDYGLLLQGKTGYHNFGSL